jgi:opacity protein-like surface antigen
MPVREAGNSEDEPTMKMLLLAAVSLIVLAGTAQAQNVVNGVDRNSQAYKAAYLKTFTAGACDVNLSQDNYQSAGKAYADPLFRRDRALWQACQDNTASGGARTGGFTADGQQN